MLNIIHVVLSTLRVLRYGENPHQRAAWYEIAGVPPGVALIQGGKELSATNLLDLYGAWLVVRTFPDSPAACVIKHTAPCGVAVADNITQAYVLARDADHLSAFGGIVGVNRPVTAELAQAIIETFIECVVAPEYDGGALAVFEQKRNIRVLEANPSVIQPIEYRSVFGTMIAQEVDLVEEALQAWPSDDLRVMTKREPTSREWEALRFAWVVAARTKSNGVVVTTVDRSLGIGGGQPNRVDSARIAAAKAESMPRGLKKPLRVAASDAFIPFPDTVEALHPTVTAIVQTGGSKKDDEAIAAADEHGIAMVFTGRRHFRH
ncbi:hypothetical protein HY629_01355 [Candidatus Uhrbacteria bacterium]|nr:hypothetical protein [Candidatus Uhrbacteria bacterium]